MDIESRYNQALDFLYSQIDYSIIRNLRYTPERFDLNRMIDFMRILGNPQNSFPSIHVAGSKGKGSICAMLTSILNENGMKTGFYSSPHMIDFTERIQIGNKQITKSDFVEYTTEFKKIKSMVPEISTFELTTAMAFKYFFDKNVDLAVIEVGMGGRFDATNIINPIISVIASISIDHRKILGNTIAKIAREKAGIIKKDTPVVVAPLRKSAEQVILRIAKEKHARVYSVRDLYDYQYLKFGLDGQYFSIHEKLSDIKVGKFFLPLIGNHQVINAVVAFSVINVLQKNGWGIQANAIEAGFKNVDWPGRFEILQKEPLVIIDGAHNPDSFNKLVRTIKKYLSVKKIIFIFGVSEDKDVKNMLRIIYPVCQYLILTSSEHPRAIPSEDLAKIARKMHLKCSEEPHVEDSFKKALSLSNNDTAVVASGSLFIAAAIKEILKAGGD